MVECTQFVSANKYYLNHTRRTVPHSSPFYDNHNKTIKEDKNQQQLRNTFTFRLF